MLKKRIYDILPHFVVRGLNILYNEGLYTFIYKIREHAKSGVAYEKWITEKEEREKRENKAISLSLRPLISILVPVYNVDENILRECIESVLGQIYDNWQLCIADDCSTMPEVRKVLSEYEDCDRIDICYREKNGHISAATNSALSLAKGEYIALLDCDDILAEDALYEVAKVINESPDVEFIYTDEDKVDENGKNRNTPHFKSDWAPDTLMSYMYTCHLSVYKTDIARDMGGFREGYEGAQDYDFVLRYTEMIKDTGIRHIPKVLYHWRVRKGSTSEDISAKPYVMHSVYKAKSEALTRRGLNADMELVESVSQYNVNYIPDAECMVSIIIPSKDNPDMLGKCLNSIRSKTLFSNYEIIVNDNGSNDANRLIYEDMCKKYRCTYHYESMEFNFSRMCNNGANLAAGSYYLFLNDDIEVTDGEWLQRMLGQAQLPHTGAVGAKLLYPDSFLIQHTGVINILNGPSHAFCGYSDKDVCPFARNLLTFNYSAVTAACLMISKDKFYEVGGFNENMSVSYNDVDLCFSLIEKGYYNVVRNDVSLYHYESFSRGYDSVDEHKMKRLIREREKLYDMHSAFTGNGSMDPFYNANLVQNRVDFTCNYDNIGDYNSVYKEKRISDYKINDNIQYSIDRISMDNGFCISGWAYLKGSRLNNIRRAKILVIYDDGRVHEFAARKIYRPEIGCIVHKKRMYMIGFECASNMNIAEGARLAIAIGSGYLLLDDYSKIMYSNYYRFNKED